MPVSFGSVKLVSEPIILGSPGPQSGFLVALDKRLPGFLLPQCHLSPDAYPHTGRESHQLDSLLHAALSEMFIHDKADCFHGWVGLNKAPFIPNYDKSVLRFSPS